MKHYLFLEPWRRDIGRPIISKGETVDYRQAVVALLTFMQAQYRGIMHAHPQWRSDLNRWIDACMGLHRELGRANDPERITAKALDLARSSAETLEAGLIQDERITHLLRITIASTEEGLAAWAGPGKAEAR